METWDKFEFKEAVLRGIFAKVGWWGGWVVGCLCLYQHMHAVVGGASPTPPSAAVVL